MYGAYTEKINQLESYTIKLNKLKESTDITAIRKGISEVLRIYDDEITNAVKDSIYVGLRFFTDKTNISRYYEDIDQLIGSLNKIKAETIIEASKKNEPYIQISQNQSQSQSIEITFSQAISSLSKQNLSSDDFAELTKMLSEFEEQRKAKNKASLWEKAKNVLKYLLDKSIEVGVAVLPYLASNLY